MKRFFQTGSKKKQYVVAFFSVAIAAAVCLAFSGVIGYRVAALVLLLVVSLLAVIFDILPVLFAAALSALIWDLLFIPPRFELHVDTTEDAILLTMYFVIAMVNGVLTYKIRQVEKTARLREEKANSVKLYNTILSSLSHELRTPISTIIAAADNLQMNPALEERTKQILTGEISQAALRLNQQVENLLNISRLESGHIQPKADWCDVEELIYDVVRRVEENNPQRKVGISISPLPLCWLDKGMLDQVIYNILNNAAIHTEPGVKIDIMANCHTDLLELSIEDQGKGFSPAETKDVFQKFSRNAATKTKGSGLGLSIAKGFTDALGGSIELTRGAQGGALFTIALVVKTSTA